MPGLPGATPEKDLELFKLLWTDPNYKPDQLKIYPTQVMQNTGLAQDFKLGKFTPYTLDQIQELLVKMFTIIPEYCRTMRVMRQFSPEHLVAGTTRISLRKDIDEDLRERNVKLNEIRYREIGHNQNLGKEIDQNIEIKTLEYEASNGKEFFIAAEDEKKDIIFGYCRLRFPSQFLRKEITKNSALIREIHIYSLAVQIGKKSADSFQHRGIGKKLMQKAEEIVKNNNKSKIVVIAGVGAKQYFEKLGYEHDGPYMSKILN